MPKTLMRDVAARAGNLTPFDAGSIRGDYAAFHRGEPCVPALDRHVTDALDVLDLPVGGAVRNGEHVSAAGIFRAWLAGWTAANLAANPSGLPA